MVFFCCTAHKLQTSHEEDAWPHESYDSYESHEGESSHISDEGMQKAINSFEDYEIYESCQDYTQSLRKTKGKGQEQG